MAKFNPRAKTERNLSEREDVTVNHEGGLAFRVDEKMELYLRSAASLFGEPKFYTDGEDENEVLRLVGEVAKTDPAFPLKLASYCRNEMYLRSTSIALLVESCAYPSKQFVRSYTPDIIKRADELTETMAFYKMRNGDIGDKTKKGMLSNPLKRGLADAFHNFNEHQLAKYDRDGDVKLKDVLKVVHPKPQSPAEEALFKRVLTRTLAIPETWETHISKFGSNKESWETILPKMPFMARLRNLRNFLQKDVDVAPVIKMLKDEKAVRKSKQFPYRFLSAYKEIQEVESKQAPSVLGALETALELSVANVPHLKGTTFITSDNSGSMRDTMSERSKMTRIEVGGLMAAMSNKFCDDAVCSVFGENFAVVNLNPKDSILTNSQKLAGKGVGHNTNAWKAIDYLNRQKLKVDRVILFSDEQCYDDRGYGESLAAQWQKYRSAVNPKAIMYSIDLAGYGTSQFPQDANVCLLAGWSDRVLQFIPAYEQKESVLKHIESIQPGEYSKKSDE